MRRMETSGFSSGRNVVESAGELRREFEVEDIVPFGVETGESVRFDGMFHPVASNLTMAEARRSRINAFGIEYEGKTGMSPPISPGPPDSNGPRWRRARHGVEISPRLRGGTRAAWAGRSAYHPRRHRLVVDSRTDAGHGQRAVDRSRDARLVPRRLGRDDGRDDVSLGRADDCAVFAHDQTAVTALAAAIRGGLPPHVGGCACSHSSWPKSGPEAWATCSRGTVRASGWQAARS